jgi:hypothetical protein
VGLQPAILSFALALPLTIINCAGTAIAGQPGGKQPLVVATPIASGVCGVCADGTCPTSSDRFRLFDPGQGVLIRNLACDRGGHFRINLQPGRYVLDRSGVGDQLKEVRGGQPIDVKKDQWIRLDGLSDADCPNSGIYGLDNAPCWGTPPDGVYKCVEVLNEKTGAIVATGECDLSFPVFSIVLPPGRYRVKSAYWLQRTVEIVPGRWTRLGVTEAAPCLPLP